MSNIAKFQPLTVINLRTESAIKFSDYLNVSLSLVNDHVARISIMTAPFYWHLHPNSDEMFLVVEGILCIDFETYTVELLPGEMLTIPTNIKHRTRPKGKRSVNITFEHKEMKTIQFS